MFVSDISHVKPQLAQSQLLKLMLKKFLMHSFIEKQTSKSFFFVFLRVTVRKAAFFGTAKGSSDLRII